MSPQIECFQRLVCDLTSTSRQGYVSDLGKLRTMPGLTKTAGFVLEKLLDSIDFGLKNRRVDLCEERFNQCPFNGKQMALAMRSEYILNL